MAEFPYSPTPAKLPDFFRKIQTIGKPEKVTHKYLKSIGFMSSNDRYILSILKSLGFLDSSGVPTDRWQDYRNKKKAPAALAHGILEAYADLFAVYPDAYRKDDEAITNFFTSNTTVGEKTVAFMSRTYKYLCALADFETPVAPRATEADSTVPLPKVELQQMGGSVAGMPININIQLTLPETKDSTIYDSIFKSLKKHLLS